MEIAAMTAMNHATAAGTAGAAPIQVGYGVSLGDIGSFAQALQGASAKLEAHAVSAPSEAAKQLMKPFEHINNEANKLSVDASTAQNAGRDMTPAETIQLTMKCQEFMFHCQLTSNIANRTSDGLQQLFRQQS